MKFKQRFSKFKLILCAIVLVLASILGVCSIKPQTLDVYAVSFEDVANAFSNPNFDSNTSSTYPFRPNGYEASSEPKEDNKYLNGVINLNDAEYSSKYKNHTAEEKNQYVLMIAQAANYTSSSVTLDADSHYQISVLVYTDVNSAIASVILQDPNSTESKTLSSIEDISSVGKWSEYKFYVSTSELASQSVQLCLSANGQGVTLFDNLNVRKLSEKALVEELEATGSKNYVDKRLGNTLVSTDMPSKTNKMFTRHSNYPNVIYDWLTSADETVGAEISDGKNNTAFVVTHEEKTFSKFLTEEDYLTFKQNTLYKLSITAKVLNLDGSASLRIAQTNAPKDDAKSQSLSLTSSEGDKFMNGYTKYSFFVKAPSTYNAQCQLELLFGAEETDDAEESLASGQIFISEIELIKVDYSTFNAGSNKLEFTETAAEGMIDNGEFNLMQIKDASKPYPATPDSWTVGVGTGKQVYGVINTGVDDYAKMIEDNNLTQLKKLNPNAGASDNVLMMFNAEAGKLTYTSATKSITAGSGYHAFYFEVYPVISSVNVALVKNNNGEYVTLCSKDYQADGSWQHDALFITSPYQDLDVSVQITLDSRSWGACFVDDVALDNPAPEDNTVKAENAVDLSNFFAANELSSNSCSTPSFFVGSGDGANIRSGVLDLNSSTLNDVLTLAEDDLLALKYLQSDNKQVLAILADEKTFYSYSSKIGLSLTSNSYYRFSIDVFTQGVTEGKGASVALSDFESAFKEIKTSGWQTYTFFIKPDTSTNNTTLTLSIGSADEVCNGKVFFGNIQFEKLDVADDDAFNEIAKPGPRTLVVNKVVAEEEDDTTDTNETKSDGNKVNWWYVAPSLIFALAIIICVVGVLVRKVKWKKPGKKVKNAYDRNKTVSVQYYTRQATIEREKRVRELQKEIDSLTSQRAKYEDEYKRDLTKMRELKIKRAAASEISALDKDMKKNRKMTSAIGLNINKLEGELSYTRSDAYLNSLIKKLSTQKRPEPEQAAAETTNETNKTTDTNKTASEKSKTNKTADKTDKKAKETNKAENK